MASGVENQIGIGMAQVLPKPASMMPLVDQLNQQAQIKFQRQKYEQHQKEQNEKELFGLVGDALNLRDFNPVIHDKVKKAQIELAQKIKSEKPSYADTYLLAQNKAGELGQLSQGLNQLDQQIALTKKEYEGDKRINSAAIEMIARKKILDQLNTTGKVDPNVNYFDEALNEYPQFALTDNSDYTVTDFIPEEKQSLSGKYSETNKRGATDKFEWKADNFPAYYDFKDNGEAKAPTLTTRSQESGLVDANKQPIPMLSNEAYGRFKAKPSNVIAINRRLKNLYGDALDLKSEQAEILRKVEAFKEVDKYKPRVNTSRLEKEAPAPRITINNNGNKNDPPQIDLREYKDVTGGKDITDLLRGVKVTGLPTGSSLLAESVVYDPVKKLVTYKEYTDGKESTPKTVSLTKFKQDIKTLNPTTDMKFLEGLDNPITGTVTVPQQEPAKAEPKKDWLGRPIKQKEEPKTDLRKKYNY